MKPREDKDYNVINLVFNCGEEKAQVIGISEMSEKKIEQRRKALHRLLGEIHIYRAGE